MIFSIFKGNGGIFDHLHVDYVYCLGLIKLGIDFFSSTFINVMELYDCSRFSYLSSLMTNVLSGGSDIEEPRT
jgi:hypothetical protein